MLRSETAASPDRYAAALKGLQAYQQATRTSLPPPMPALHAVGRACLRDYGGTGRPLIFIPSLINPPDILDLGEERSMLRWFARRGMRPLLLDWGYPHHEDRHLDLAAHVERLVVPLIAALDAPPVLIGYCLGGTIAIAGASLTGVAGVATIAAPWHFSGYGAAREPMQALWRQARAGCEALGLVPMEVLQAGFWQLDPARTIAKYEAFAAFPSDSAAAQAFVRLEDWANAGAPLPFAVGESLFESLITDDLSGRGAWSIGGKIVGPAALRCRAIEFVSSTDRIVPAATAAGLEARHDLSIGHVGMIVGSRARDALWAPLADWIDSLG